ncbi:MAG: cupredoxin domain-containing protein [Actinomycetota bacterium]
MTHRRLGPVVVIALIVTATVTGLGSAMASADGSTAALGPGEVTVQIDIEYSRFIPERLTVVEGTKVRFLVVNGDPIHHELITGEPEVHLRHANGTEAKHPSIPGEVSVGPNGRAVTTFTFDRPGTFEFACHLPRHYEYGMRGEVEVVAAPSG